MARETVSTQVTGGVLQAMQIYNRTQQTPIRHSNLTSAVAVAGDEGTLAKAPEGPRAVSTGCPLSAAEDLRLLLGACDEDAGTARVHAPLRNKAKMGLEQHRHQAITVKK